MSTKKELFDLRIVSDLIVLAGLIITVLLFVQYSNSIQNEVTTILLQSLNDLNGGVASAGK